MVHFEVFGDSNVAKSWKAVASDLEQLRGSVLCQTTTQISLRDHLKTVAQTTRYAIVSAISNPISKIKFEGPALVEQAVVDRCSKIRDYLLQTLNNNPELKVSGLKGPVLIVPSRCLSYATVLTPHTFIE
jgi:hypothetical protein